MHSRWQRAAIAALLAISSAAHGATLSFGVFGDVPYSAAEEPQLVSMIAEMNREPLAFSMHVGDFKSGGSECSDALFRQRREQFDLSHHAFIYIPGDNEWTDCRRARWAPHEPQERLAKLRTMFFPKGATLGQAPLPVMQQTSRGYPEHLRWTRENIVFATFNIPGASNNSGDPAEATPRTAAVLDWIGEAFGTARKSRSPAVVLAMQANIWNGSSAYDGILRTITDEARRFNGAVLVVHGDTHWFRFDQPLIDPASGQVVGNVRRLEVPGSPFVNWIHVTIDTTDGAARFRVVPGSDLHLRR